MPVFASGGAWAGDVVFPSLSAPWLHNGAVIVPDPGLPLTEAATDPWGIWRSQPSVRKVVDFIARNVASIPFQVFERVTDTDRARVTEAPLARLLATPARLVTPYRFWHGLLVDLLLYDRFAAMLVPSAETASGFELLRVPATRMRFVADEWERITSVVLVDANGHGKEFGPERFVYDHGYGGANGTPPIETLAEVLAEYREAVTYRRGVWRNSARVPSVVERPLEAPKWSSEARSRWVESFKRFLRGGGQEGGTPLLEDGMQLKTIGAFSPKDSEDIEGRRLTDIEVASAYHIPPELVGARQGNYSNMEAFRQSLYRDALGPVITQLEQALNAMLVPALGADGLYVEANVETKLRGSFEEQAKVLQSSVGAPWLTRNEARARANLPAVANGDDLITPLNVTEGGLASPRDTAPDTANVLEAL